MIQKIILKFIRFYQLFVSPILLPTCRYVPCCSDYSKIAIQTKGTFKGSWMTLIRLAKCHPFSKGGWDPVVLDTQKNIRGND